MKKLLMGILVAAALTAGVCAAEHLTRPAPELPKDCVRLALSHSEDHAAGVRRMQGEEVETKWVADIVVCPGVPGSVGGPQYGGTLFIELKEID